MKFLLAAVILLAAGSAAAQERAATGPINSQTTWSALSTQIDSFKTQLADANARLQKFETCGKKAKAYAPGQAGTDSDSCMLVTAPPVVIPTPTAPVVKVQSAVFTENGPTTLPNVTTYCTNKGYTAAYEYWLNITTGTRHCGGSTGGDCSYSTITGYTIGCMRAVVQ